MPYQQQNDVRTKINTDGIQLYGDTSTIKFDFWSHMITVKIHPVKDPADQGNGVYDYKKRTNSVLTVDKAVFVGRFILDELIPAIKKNEAKSLAVQTSKVNLFYISSGVAETGAVEPYIGLFCDINESKKPDKFDIFKFRKSRVFSSYDYKNGTFTSEDNYLIELTLLGEFLVSSIHMLGAVSHGIDYSHAYDNENESSFMEAIGSKLGVAYRQKSSSPKYAAKADPWAEGDNAAASAPVNSVASLDDIGNLMSKSTIKKLNKKLLIH